jgi:hypothetical protein
MKCQTCDSDNAEDAKFCAGCGVKLYEAYSSVATSNPRSLPATLLIAIRIVLIAIALGIVLVVLEDDTYNQTIIPWLGALFLIAGLFIFPRRGSLKVWDKTVRNALGVANVSMIHGVKAIRVWGGGSLMGLGVAPAYYLLQELVYVLLVLPAFIGIIVASVFRVRKLVLVTVGYLTLLSVVSYDLGTGGFNLTFEQRNLSAYSFLLVGLVWGLVWSTPFALWAWLKGTK